MPLSLIVGPPNSGRAGEIQAHLAAALSRDPVLVVPTADDRARFERELCGRDRAVVGVSIQTFAGLSDEIAAATGAEVKPRLSAVQRLSFVRATTRETDLDALSASAARRGFGPALERLIGELQAALVQPVDLAHVARLLDDGAYESELARLYAGYEQRREAAGRDDQHSAARRVAAALRERPESWGSRPVFLYGFDDLTEEQLELLAALARAGEATVAVNYADREALAARAGLLTVLRGELSGQTLAELPFDDGYSPSASLRHLDRYLFEPGAPRIEPDGGVALLECAGERGEVEAVGGEVAKLLAGGVPPDEIAVVLRDPERRGALYREVFESFGIPVAVEASVPLARTAAGRGVAALARASLAEGDGAELLAFMRARPGEAQEIGDWLERRICRGEARTTDELLRAWKAPPRLLRGLRGARPGGEWLRALAAAAHELAEEPHARSEPVARAADGGEPGVPFEPLELRAAAGAASTLTGLAELEAIPGCAAPPAVEALELLDEVRVPLWRGSTEGRVRVLSPYRARATRARHLFVASLQDGEFPRGEASDPLLGDERRARLGIPALTRRDPAVEERYLFHACTSRPTERLWLCWRSSDDEGRPASRSAFVDDVLDLFAPGPREAEERLKRVFGLDRVVFEPDEAPTRRELERALAARGPRVREPLPGPLTSAAVLDPLSQRDPIGPGTLEKWIECPYRWFVDHELEPQRLEPDPDPLTAGSVVHEVLKRLYREPPGDDGIPRPQDLGRWRARAATLMAEEAERHGLDLSRPPARILLARMRAQVERLLEREARSNTELRPKLVEVPFGEREADVKPPLDLAGARIHGQIDRVDVTPDGRFGVVYDYKTGSKAWAAAKLGDEGKLQLQLYARALRDLWEIEPIGGLYHPLGAREDRPRGFVVREIEAADALELSRTDRLDADEVTETLDAGVAVAREKAQAMHRGRIARDPNGGRCPKWCRYQPICRLERSVGTEDTGNGGATGNGEG